MSRYIEYEPIMAELEKEVKLADDWKTAHEIANVVKYAQSIDIVHCRECKYADSIKCPMYRMGLGYTDDDFCSYGERRRR